MRIALIAPLDETVPPDCYGGVELVVANLARELVSMGHDVSVLASGNSTVAGRLIPIFAHNLRSDPLMVKYRNIYSYSGTGRILQLLREHRFDIIHNHFGWQILPFATLVNTPIVTTLHGPLNAIDQQLCFGPYADENFVSISNNQRKGMPQLHYVANVYNGIQTDAFSGGKTRRDYLAFLGRISPEKGIVEAIQVARAANVPLRIAAKVDPIDQTYFRRKVRPLIDGKFITFIGEVRHAEKVTFLQGARALLMPIQWEEPFGLVNIEALACGTPVIGLKRGSLPEIIDDGKTGFLCNDENDMATCVAKLPALNAAVCRAAAEQRFSARTMAESYLTVYKTLAA